VLLLRLQVHLYRLVRVARSVALPCGIQQDTAKGRDPPHAAAIQLVVARVLCVIRQGGSG
jgi:hypothetical protein